MPGVPASYGLPPAPAGTLRERTLPTDSVAIQDMLDTAIPGDSFLMPAQTVVFEHEPTIWSGGTATNPVSLRGTDASVWESGSNDYGLHVMDAPHVHILGGHYNIAKKGVVLDNSPYGVLRYVRITHVGQEAMHFRASSHHGLAEHCTIEGTGEENANFGEGFYVGTHDGNWTSTYANRSRPVMTGEQPLGNSPEGRDDSHSCILRFNDVINCTGEGLDYKQGITGLEVRGNRFYACGWSGANSADSAIDLKGSKALLIDNEFSPLMPDGSMPTNPDAGLVYTQKSCIQARILTAPWGVGQIVKGNVAVGTWTGWLFEEAQGSTGNTVYDDNIAPGAALGVSTSALTPASEYHPMATRIPTAAQNAAVKAITDRLDAGPGPAYVEIRTGAQPSTANTAATGTVLAVLTCSDPAFGAPSAGTATAGAIVGDSSADASGTAGWFRAYDSTGATVIDGSITASGGGGDMVLASTAIVAGGTVSASSWTITMPSGA